MSFSHELSCIYKKNIFSSFISLSLCWNSSSSAFLISISISNPTSTWLRWGKRIH